MNRREFIKGAIGAILALSAIGRSSGAYKSKVIDVRSEKVWKGDEVDVSVLGKMLDEGMMELTGRGSPEEAWKDFIAEDDTVGLKVNASSAPDFHTHRELVEIVVERIKSVGVPPEKILIWERFEEDLVAAGFEINVTGPGVRCYATDGRGPGYDENVFYEPEEDSPPRREGGRVRSFYSRIVTREVTKIINLPLLKHHGITGVSLSLKNIAFGAVDNTARFHPIEFMCDPAIPEIFSHPVLKEKVVLNIIDGLIGTYDGGPAFKADKSWKHSGLIISPDPVAADRIGMEIIDERRKEKGLESVSVYARHIFTAGRLGLGNSSLSDIAVKKMIL